VEVAAQKAVGKPQLKPGVTACKPNNAIAWVPTMARPRKLEVYYNGTSVLLSQVRAVVLAVINVGTKTPALHSLELLLDTGALYRVHTGTKAGPPPACAALNDYAVPASGSSLASARVVGVRVTPNQERVVGKTQLIHVRAMHCLCPV
jgi:hypothetical protein